MNQDRFVRITKNLFEQDCGLYTNNVIELLRREHAAVVRAVKRLSQHKWAYVTDYAPEKAYRDACADILAMLERRKK